MLGVTDREIEQAKFPFPTWTMMTSHGMVLLYIAINTDATVREIAARLELTERRVIDVIRDLSKDNYLDIERQGRCNHYTINPNATFRHPLLTSLPFNDLVHAFKKVSHGSKTAATPEAGVWCI